METTQAPKVTVITKEEISGLITRSFILSNLENQVAFLKNEKQIYWDSLAKKYGLDPKKDYIVNQDSSCLIERPTK